MPDQLMRFGIDVPTAGEFADPLVLADLAHDAEKAGWDGFFIWDVLFANGQMDVPVVDPWISIAAIAMRTRTLRIGVFMAPLSRYRPWQVARSAVALDHLSSGRLIFGAGLGYQALDFVPFGEEFDAKTRAARLDESLDVLAGLWSGETFSYAGKHFNVKNAQFLPRPIQAPRIPIWTAGGWPNRKPFNRAARWDGVYLMDSHMTRGGPITPSDVGEILAFIREQRKSSAKYDIAVYGHSPSSAKRGASLVTPYATSGATWWIEAVPSETIKAYRKRIIAGPPRL